LSLPTAHWKRNDSYGWICGMDIGQGYIVQSRYSLLANEGMTVGMDDFKKL